MPLVANLLLSAAAARIEGLPGVVKHDLLDNRREVLVQDFRSPREQQHALCGQWCCHQQSSHYAVTRTCGRTVDYV